MTAWYIKCVQTFWIKIIKKNYAIKFEKVIKKLFFLNKQIINCLKEKIFKVILKGD